MSEEILNNCNDGACASDCSSCGCGCGSSQAEPALIPLAFEDGTIVQCMEVTKLMVEDQMYTVLLPLNDEGQNENGNVFVYRIVTNENGETLLANIESDEEYAKVSVEFNKMVSNLVG